MACGPGAPIPYQLSLAHFASANLALRATKRETALLHLRLAVNCLVGREGGFQPSERKHFRRFRGVTDPGDLTLGIGGGIIPDLKDLKKHHDGESGEKWDESMEFALEAATLAHKVAEQALKMTNLADIQRSAQMVASLLHSALEGCLA